MTDKAYKKWLSRKATAHYKRDKARGFKNISGALYKEQIHQAVQASRGRDAYTGELLSWKLISQYRNRKFNSLPTADHCHECDGGGFKICSWLVNDMKKDMTEKEFFVMCKKVLKHQKK